MYRRLLLSVALPLHGCKINESPVVHGGRWALKLAWFWVVLEALNGCAHIVWAASVGAYRPGLATAPVLLAIALVLGWRPLHYPSTTDAAITDS